MQPESTIPSDPAQRFREIHNALDQDRSWFQGATSLRFAAVAAITCPGSATDLAASIRRAAEEFVEASSWTDSYKSEIRFILSACLVRSGDRTRAFIDEVRRVREMFRDHKLRRGGMYEVMAILVMRQARELSPIRAQDIHRFMSIYEEMKKHHWWLTGPDDFPACAIFVSQSGSPSEVAARAKAHYDSLREGGASRGNPLQTAANLLVLSSDQPAEAAHRFHELEQRFKDAGLWMHAGDYDELAILTFLRHAPERIVERLLAHRKTIEELRPKPGKELSFDLAASLAFLELVSHDQDMNQITDAKALLDMQAIIAAQQAAAVAAATSAAVAASAATS
ncbi:MAG: hypothetical protein CMJ83_03035 [Planctomycetes bacterium]|nr:hypothetical protein [Planctomycetota bacterium]